MSRQRRAREENLVDAAAFCITRWSSCVIVPPPPPKTAMSSAPAFAKLLHHFGEELDVPAVVTGDADGPHILLDRGAHDVLRIAMIAEINHFDPMPDELEIDRIDRAVVPVADRDGGEDADRSRPWSWKS